MKHHRMNRQFDLWSDPARLARIIDPSTLSVVRLEPISYSTCGAAMADLSFDRDGELIVVPTLFIDPTMLSMSESSPFIWPQSVACAIDLNVSDALEALLLPWILSLSLGRLLNREVVRIVRAGSGSEAFAQAAELGLLGAASYERVAKAMAAYALAVPVARGRRCVVVDAPAGGSGVALLARSASWIDADFGSANDDVFVRRWFDRDFGRPTADGEYDVAISRSGVSVPDAPRRFVIGEGPGMTVPIVEPVAMDTIFAYDVNDGPAVGVVNVEVPEPGLHVPFGAATPAPIGGSAGRILFALREDAVRAPDADSDEALALAHVLRAEGFTVDVAAVTPDLDLRDYDLVHAFSLPAAAQFDSLSKTVSESGVPLIVTANLPDIAAFGHWGSGMTAIVERTTLDGTLMAERLELIAKRRLNSLDMTPGNEPYAGYHDTVRRTLGRCDGAIVRCAAEGALLTERFGFAGEMAEVRPFALTDARVEPVAGLAGDGDFVFAHVSISPRANLLALARGAEAAQIPLVVAGAVDDAAYLTALRRWSAEGVTILTSLSDGQIASLYRRARVFADVSWIPAGLSRPLRALLSGCRVVLASDSYGCAMWDGIVTPADPASATAIAAGLSVAWVSAADPAATARQGAGIVAACDPAQTLSATVNLYARAAGRRANP